MAAIGRAHSGAGMFQKATPLLERALAIRRRELPADDLQIAENLHQLAPVYLFQGRTAEAERCLRESLKIHLSRTGDSDETLIMLKANLAVVLGLSGDALAEAERLWLEVLAVRRQSLDANDPRIAEALIGLGGVMLWGDEVGGKFRPLEAVP